MISKTLSKYKILKCYFTTLECKVLKKCNFLKWSEITINTVLLFSFEDWFPYEEEAKSDEALASLVAPSSMPLRHNTGWRNCFFGTLLPTLETIIKKVKTVKASLSLYDSEACWLYRECN